MKVPSVSALLPKISPPARERVSAESLVSVSTDVISELEDLDDDLQPIAEPAAPPVVTRLPQRKPSLRHARSRSQKALDNSLPRPELPVEKRRSAKPRGPTQPSKPSPPLAMEPTDGGGYVSPPASPKRAPRPYLHERSPTKELIARQSKQQLGYFEPEASASWDSEPPAAAGAPEEPPKSPTQQQADDILASVANASPSPTKPKPRHTLSLDERTRLSMAGSARSSRLPDDEEDRLPPLPTNSSLRKSKTAIATVAEPPIREDEENDRDLEYEDIVARTQRSMLGYEAARQRAQLERRRSARRSRREGSQFYKAAEQQFSSVREDDGGEGESRIAEELMGGEQSYEDVFMSRPKIQASPIPREWEE